MNYKRQLESLRESRDSWLVILNNNPDNVEAATYVLRLNSKIEFVKTLKILDGDYS